MLKRICFVTTGDIKNNAAAKRALGMATPLSDIGWKVYIIMEDSKENRHRVSLECDGRIRVFYYPSSSVLKEVIMKKRILAKIKPDYIYLCAFVFRNIVPLSLKCKKLVEHSELLSKVCHRKMIRRIFDGILECCSIIYADGLLNASKYLQNTYIQRMNRVPFINNKPMLYFPYAYNSRQMQIRVGQLPEFKTNADKTYFVYLGTIAENYGIFTIIEAAKKLKETHPVFCVIVLGYGKDYGNAVKLVEEYGLNDNVYMHGFVEEEKIASYFSLASAFISPMNDTVQDWARCPSKLYMYLPYGKPVITCRIGEPLLVLGDSGLYYLPDDSSSLKEQMKRVMNNDFASLNVNPLLHTWEARAAAFNEWINEYVEN